MPEQNGAMLAAPAPAQPASNRESAYSNTFSLADSLEKGVVELPELSRREHLFATFRYRIFIVYRRLFSIVFLSNLTALVVILTRERNLLDALSACAANLLVTGLARQPLVINAVYLCIGFCLKNAPLRIRHYGARAAHYGGIHSGAGVAALFWYIAFLVLLTLEFDSASTTVSTPVLGISYAILFLLLLIVVSAYPKLRFKSHDTFELTHRFSVWTLFVLFWTVLLLFAEGARVREQESLGSFLVNLPTFWFSIVLTVSLVIPYLTLSRVTVRPEYLSPHAVRLHFDYTTIKAGQGISVSTHPLKDWHSFACLPDLPGKGFSCVVSKAGNWTSACIENQPTRLWKRSIPAHGFGYTTKIFKRFIVVTTGSGIGPALSLLALKPPRNCRVVWQTRDPLKTYGQGVLDLVAMLDPNATIIDTDRSGRQDMVALAWKVAKEFDAEAAYVISNPKVTKEIVFGLESRGVAAYGPIFDS